ncbi:hypothetical protein MPER_11171, partial [Moniliophthora perniciosa FA553]
MGARSALMSMMNCHGEIRMITDPLQLFKKACPIPQASLELLNHTVEGRLFNGATLISPCILNLNSSQCQEARSKYLDESEQCLLDHTNPSDISPVLPPHSCKLGSVPNYFIDVRVAKDVQAGFAFAKEHNVFLVVKNNGRCG